MRVLIQRSLVKQVSSRRVYTVEPAITATFNRPLQDFPFYNLPVYSGQLPLLEGSTVFETLHNVILNHHFGVQTKTLRIKAETLCKR